MTMSKDQQLLLGNGSISQSTPQNEAQVLNPPLFKLKILESLKNGDYQQLVRIVDSVKGSVNYSELVLVKNLIINLAVQVAPLKLVTQLLSEESAKELSVDINYQDADGNTPLHLSAINTRLDVAQVLLKDPRINDTLLNNDLKQPIEVAKDLDMVTLLQYERAKYVEKIANQFRQAFTNHDFARLEEIMSSSRNFELLDINGTDPKTGYTVLHEFVLKNDLGMVKWILNHGGDPFKRDRQGKLPIELVPKGDEPMKNLIRDSSKEQTVISPTRPGGALQAPTFKGYLRKWTNFASGYKLRWFILDSNGILSYYQSQDDTNNSCRGSLNMRNAVLHLDSSETLKFEIIGNNDVRWHLKGNHPVETNRWVWSLQGAIRAAKDRERVAKHLLSIPKTRQQQAGEKLGVNGNLRNHLRDVSTSSAISQLSSNGVAGNGTSNSENTALGSMLRRDSGIINNSDDDDDDDDGYEGDQTIDYSMVTEDENIDVDSGPYAQEIQVLKRGFALELNSLKELLIDVKKSGVCPEELEISLKSVNSLTKASEDLTNLVSKRDEKLVKSLQKQKDINDLWIRSIRDLETELVQRNNELHSFENERKLLKKALSKRFRSTSSVDQLSLYNAIDKTGVEGDTISEKHIASPMTENKSRESIEDQELSRFINEEDEEEDEFFDADDFSDGEEIPEPYDANQQGELEEEENKIKLHQGFEELNDLQKQKYMVIHQQDSFKGYEEPMRTDLPLKIDERPKVSLWAVLKSMIGKDITKISLPVVFNEPTSLLQRVAEDVEYCQLLDEAASFKDSTLRMVYIAAFAASEYSSTINRVAKPFNPLLGETFEYSRPDKGFRFFVEQVSHRPPISATITQAPKWEYYGETSVKTGFNGRSFDVQPTATWYLHLRPDDPESGEEVYTWKKVTSSVVGIIMGNPSLDNWGEMEIINNKTGDKCVVTMKPRGWRGNSAYELSGIVYNNEGEKEWAVGGHWNHKIFGKKLIKNEISVDSNKRISDSPNYEGNKFLIWQVTPRPQALFNLTAYAITLNNLSDSLKPWLPKSDTRFRPDQRAMEEGHYDDAATLKNTVEEKQRATRRQRELEGTTYKPRFFSKKIHPLTNEEYYEFNGDYWALRKEHKIPDIDIF